jgi:hypothetical protein
MPVLFSAEFLTPAVSLYIDLFHADYTSFPLITKLEHRDVITIHYLLFPLLLLLLLLLLWSMKFPTMPDTNAVT